MQEHKPKNALDKKKIEISEIIENTSVERESWVSYHKYYYNYISNILSFFVEPEKRVLFMKSDTGDLLKAVEPSFGLGLDYSDNIVGIAKSKYPEFQFRKTDFENIHVTEKFDYILVVNLIEDIVDIYKVFSEIAKIADERTRIVIMDHNFIWYPLLKLAQKVGWKMKQPALNWLTEKDTENLLDLAGFEVVKKNSALLCPVYIPLISTILNKFVSHLPLINRLNLMKIWVAKKKPSHLMQKDCTVSVIVPCRNEEGNIEEAVKRIPEMGKGVEIIFVYDKSKDNTRAEMVRCIEKYKDKDIKLVDGPGIDKASAVWLGFEKSKGDLLMILDADLTVLPEELPNFYRAIVNGDGEFINGSRMIYPMEEEAMRPFNIIGNKFFSIVFTFLLKRNVRDTLCGTKVFLRSDYIRMKKFFNTWNIKDCWGDHEMLFSASKINMKIIDMPVHYVNRAYGETMVHMRIRHGLRILKMCFGALKNLILI